MISSSDFVHIHIRIKHADIVYGGQTEEMASHIKWKQLLFMIGIPLSIFLLFGFLYPLHYAAFYEKSGIYLTDNLLAKYVAVTETSLFGKAKTLDKDDYKVTGIHGNTATVEIGNKDVPVQTDIIKVKDISLLYQKEVYQGDTLDPDQISGIVTFEDGKMRKLNETLSISDKPVTGNENICVRTSYGIGILHIRPIMVKKVLLRNAEQELVAGDLFSFDQDLVLYFDNGKQIDVSADDIAWQEKEYTLVGGTNTLTFLWRGNTLSVSFEATQYPLIQDKMFPMSYIERNGKLMITVTKERYCGSDVYVADIVMDNPERFTTYFANGTYSSHEVMSQAQADVNAVLMINGDFRDSGYNRSYGVIRNGTVVRDRPTQESALGITYDGNYEVVENMPAQEAVKKYSDVIGIFCPLVENGKPTIYAERLYSIAPRTFVGQKPRDDGKKEYLWCIADGRTRKNRGLTFMEPAQFLIDHGCTFGYNCDGGGSSEMYFCGQMINTPSGYGGEGGERKLADFMYITPQ